MRKRIIWRYSMAYGTRIDCAGMTLDRDGLDIVGVHHGRGDCVRAAVTRFTMNIAVPL